MTKHKTKKVVVIGGGTGSSVVLSGLKQYPLDLYSIVTVADSGGSTGRLRDEFGFAPVGDLRQAIAALAVGEDQDWIRKVLLYRFAKGSGLEGHNLGNLILTGLQDITGSTAKAVDVASHIFKVNGHIYPITSTPIQLVIEYQDGTVEIGEHILDELKHAGKKITMVKTSPRANIYPPAKKAIQSADAIIIGPGDLYGSIVPNLVISGTYTAIKKSQAKIIYIMNLMTRHSQTHGLSAVDHVNVIQQYIKNPVNKVIINSSSIPSVIKARYKKQHEYPVKDDLETSTYQVLRAPLIHTQTVKQKKSDSVARSYIRHHPQKLAKIIMDII